MENQINQNCQEIPHVENIFEIVGSVENILSKILIEMGYILRFNDVKEMQKLIRLGLFSYSTEKQGKVSNENKYLVEEKGQ